MGQKTARLTPAAFLPTSPTLDGHGTKPGLRRDQPVSAAAAWPPGSPESWGTHTQSTSGCAPAPSQKRTGIQRKGHVLGVPARGPGSEANKLVGSCPQLPTASLAIRVSHIDQPPSIGQATLPVRVSRIDQPPLQAVLGGAICGRCSSGVLCAPPEGAPKSTATGRDPRRPCEATPAQGKG